MFLQITPENLPIEISGSEVASTHWVPLSHFFNKKITQTWDPVSINISSRLAPNSWIMQYMLATLTGRMHFHCIKLPSIDVIAKHPLPDKKEHMHLWGLTLQMTSDLMDLMYEPNEEPPRRLDAIRPKFDYPDVNFFIWWFLRDNRGSYRRKRLELATRRFVAFH